MKAGVHFTLYRIGTIEVSARQLKEASSLMSMKILTGWIEKKDIGVGASWLSSVFMQLASRRRPDCCKRVQ